MSRINLRKLLPSGAIAVSTLALAARFASAVPISGQYIEDPRCDTIPAQHLTHELGDVLNFPTNEAIFVTVTATPHQTVCVTDDGVANDWSVQITNVSGQTWKDLFFVADFGLKVGNADGSMIDVVGAPNTPTDSFRIDGTVTPGINNNLQSEIGGPVDEIFQPGETWTFNVSNFSDPFGLAPAPSFVTPGVFAGSSPYNPATPGITASILAIPVPEPTMISAIALVASAVLLRRPQRS